MAYSSQNGKTTANLSVFLLGHGKMHCSWQDNGRYRKKLGPRREEMGYARSCGRLISVSKLRIQFGEQGHHTQSAHQSRDSIPVRLEETAKPIFDDDHLNSMSILINAWRDYFPNCQIFINIDMDLGVLQEF